MTSAIPAVPSGLPEDLYHSAPMVLVRYPGPPAFPSTRIRKGLTVKALTLAALCAALAFFCFAIRERKMALVVPAAHAPIAVPKETAVVAAPPPRLALPESRDRKVTEFFLAESGDFQNMGPVKLKLTAVDARRGSYNLSVRSRGRQFTRTNVKLNETVRLAGAKRTAPEIVVGAIVQNRVWGYLSEPKGELKAKAHAAHRRRKRRA
jgi:hypothetical protein